MNNNIENGEKMLTENLKTDMSQKYFSMPPKFDPEEGTTVFEPENEGYGHWVGGMNSVYSPEDEKYYLYHRVRNPLGKGRGKKCRIAESEDGINFEVIWSAEADDFRANSVEVGSLIRDPKTGNWRLYISYEDSHTDAWRVDLVEAEKIEDLDPVHHRTVLQPTEYGVEWIKDPRIYIIGGLYHAFVCVPARETYEETDDGKRRPVGGDATALATSPDGRYWKDLEYVFEPGQGAQGEKGWLRARINSILYLPPAYIATIDMGETFYDNYEEKCGLAMSHDLRNWTRITTDGPWVESKYGNIRYVDALRVGDEIFYYYEYTREDQSHELRAMKKSL